MKLLLALLLVVQTARAEFSLKDDGKLFTIRIPKSDFKPGTNTLTIDKRSGSGAKRFLSNGFVFDYVGMRE